MYIKIISYLLICWAYYEPLPLSLLNPQWLLLMLKLDPDPEMKTYHKLLYDIIRGGEYEIEWSNMIHRI